MMTHNPTATHTNRESINKVWTLVRDILFFGLKNEETKARPSRSRINKIFRDDSEPIMVACWPTSYMIMNGGMPRYIVTTRRTCLLIGQAFKYIYVVFDYRQQRMATHCRSIRDTICGNGCVHSVGNVDRLLPFP